MIGVGALFAFSVQPIGAGDEPDGEALFVKSWTPAEGLGPLFNTSSCFSCHVSGGRGRPTEGSAKLSPATTVKIGVLPGSETEAQKLLKRTISSFPEPAYGQQLQIRAIKGHSAEGTMTVRYEPLEVALNGGDTVTLQKPVYEYSDLTKGPATPGALFSPRIANPLFGLLALEAIPEERILALADREDGNGDGISGKPNRIKDRVTGKIELGRFGWKAGQPTIRQQNAAAFALDMGLSTTIFPAPEADAGISSGPEVSDAQLSALTKFTAKIPVPAADRAADSPGRKLFGKAGCAACHMPNHTLPDTEAVPKQLRGKTIWPYTNMLLHDLGDGLADNFLEGDADYWEWRTPPLWGIGQTEAVNGNGFYLHDGRARTLLEAILWHGGEAKSSMQAVVDMTRKERADLLAFLNSL